MQDLIVDGVFGNDYFYEDASAFNVYRINLISNDSGVSQRVYDERGTPSDASDDTIVSTTLRDTALGYIYSGSWAHCWLEGGANTGTLVNDALERGCRTGTSPWSSSTRAASADAVAAASRSSPWVRRGP